MYMARVIWGAVFLLFGIMGAWMALTFLQQEIAYRRTEKAIARWSQLGYIDDREQWLHEYERMSQIAPWGDLNARRYALLGELWYWQAFQQRFSPQAQGHSTAQAVQAYRRALSVRPTDANMWARRLQALIMGRTFSKEAAQAYWAVRHFGPYESNLVRLLVWVVLSRWDELPRAVQADLPDLIAAATESEDGRAAILQAARESNRVSLVMPLLEKSNLAGKQRMRLRELERHQRRP